MLAHFYNKPQHEVLEYIARTYPAAFLVFLVGQGIYGYQGGDYWPAIEKALDIHVDQVAFGRTLERLLHWFHLPLFHELQERAFRYVSLILAHGGIPVYSLNDYFSQIVLPCATKPQFVGLDGQELIDEILKSSASRNVDKPILYFLEYGGQAAVNLLERSRSTLLAWQKNPQDFHVEETGLPGHIVSFFNEWARLHPIDALTMTKTRSRYKRPVLCLDPWGLGVFLRLPAQPISNLTGGSATWEVQTGDVYHETFHPRNLRTGDRFETKEMMVRLGQIADQVTVRLEVSGQEYNWSIQGYSPEHPILAFEPEDGSLQSHLYSRVLWLLIPKHLHLRVVEGEGDCLEELPPLPGIWGRLRAECWDLSQARKVGLFQNDQLVRDVIVRGQEKVQPPSLEEGTRLLPADPDQLPFYCGKLPILKIPLSRPDEREAELKRWRLSIEPSGEAIPNQIIVTCLADLDRAAIRWDGGTVIIMFDQPTLLGPRAAGTFQVSINGPLGHDAHFTFSYWPEFEVEGLHALYLPDPVKGPASAFLQVRTALLDRIVSVSATDGISVRQERSGLHTIEVAGSTSTARLALVRDSVQGMAVRVPIQLSIRRLRWRVVRDNGLIDQWLAQPLSLPLHALLQDQSPLLIVDLPPNHNEEDITHLELALKDIQGKILQVVKSVNRSGRPAGRFWRFDLNDFKHALDVSDSPIFRIELSSKGKDRPVDAFALPVMILTKEIQIKAVEGDGYASDQMSHFYLGWKEAYRLRSRAVYLWSLFRPWVPPVVVTIPDDADGEFEFSLPADQAVGGQYRAAIVVVDPWAGPPPPAMPPPAGTPGTVDIELTSAQERLKILRREINASTATITTQIAYRMEASLIYRVIGDLVAARRDLVWCCQNAYLMPARELLSLEDVLAASAFEDLRAELGTVIMRHDTMERILTSLEDRVISQDELQALFGLAPDAHNWPVETCALLVQVEDPAIRYQALYQLLNRDTHKAVLAVLDLMDEMSLSLEEAVEFLVEEKPLALEQLRTIAPDNPLAKQLMRALSQFDYYSGLPQIKPGTWVLTNAGWGRIEEIIDPRSHYSIEAFMEGEGAYILGVELHLNEDVDGEKAVIDMGKAEITFPRANRIYLCSRCGQFASGNFRRYKNHLMQHENAEVPPPIQASKIRLSLLEFHLSLKGRS